MPIPTDCRSLARFLLEFAGCNLKYAPETLVLAEFALKLVAGAFERAISDDPDSGEYAAGVEANDGITRFRCLGQACEIDFDCERGELELRAGNGDSAKIRLHYTFELDVNQALADLKSVIRGGHAMEDYHGTALFAPECAALQSLEEVLGQPVPPLVRDVGAEYGFVADKGHVTELGLSNKDLKEVPESIGDLACLTKLGLFFNQLTSLPACVGNLKSLTELSLQNNRLTSLPKTIGDLRSLQKLDLDENQLTSLPETFGNLQSLITLYLRKNLLTDLPETFGNLTALALLFLDDNQLGFLPENLGQLPSLQTLTLSHNHLTKIPETLGQLTTLRELRLNNNQLSVLPKALSNLQSLRVLDLENNELKPIPIWLKRWIEGHWKRGWTATY